MGNIEALHCILYLGALAPQKGEVGVGKDSLVTTSERFDFEVVGTQESIE